MEENLRPQVPAASPDLAVTEGCINELTRSNSNSSALTAENSKDMFHQNANARSGQCTAWTDEKHNLYLNSLEASFVSQLHRSTGLLVCCSKQNMRDPNLSRQLPASTRNSSGQFMVLRDGCWQKINYERNQPLLDTSSDSPVILDNPWIRHFRCAGKSHSIASADLQQHRILDSEGMPLRGKRAYSHGLVTSLEQPPVCHQYHQDSVGSITEVSDQNFVDEDRKEKPSSLFKGKWLKTAAADASSKDQIVPSGRFHTTETSTVGNTSSEREEQVHNKWLSEKLESFICAEPD